MTALSGSATIAPRGATSTRGAGAFGAKPSGVESEWAAPASSRRRHERPRPSGDSAGDQSEASTRSPPTLTHCACQEEGMCSYAMPGATLMPTRSIVEAQPRARERGGDHCSGSVMRADPREAPVRRAGSAKIASTPSAASSPMSRSVTSPRRTSEPSKARRFAATAPAASGSMSTASTSMPRPAIAMASDPMPQPRSATRLAPQSRNRWACRAATTRRVACSRPSRVNTMCEAKGPNLARAAWRRASWVRTATTSSASRPEARRAEPSSGRGIGLAACLACRDSSSSQPGEDRIGVRALTRSLSHLFGGEAVCGAAVGCG